EGGGAGAEELATERWRDDAKPGALCRQRAATQEKLAVVRAQAASEAEALRRQLAATEQQLASERAAAETERRSLIEQIGAHEKQLSAARDLICSTEKALEEIHASTSWKVTQPLRAAKNFLARNSG